MIKDNDVLAMYNDIWDEIRDLTNKEFNKESVCYDKYMKSIVL